MHSRLCPLLEDQLDEEERGQLPEKTQVIGLVAGEGDSMSEAITVVIFTILMLA